MPLIVSRQWYDTWLDPRINERGSVQQMLVQIQAGESERLLSHPVSAKVNSTRNQITMDDLQNLS